MATHTIRHGDPDCYVRARLWMLAAYEGDLLIVDSEDLARAAERVRHGKHVTIEVRKPSLAELAAEVGQDVEDFD